MSKKLSNNGVVDIDMIGQRVRLQEGDDRIWIQVEDIMGVIQ
ncbi:hypothetical protein [Paenibacillus thiaminolyticus]|nr:hypothetical protein [Paenibacillus thiaminolyticus]